VLSASSNAQEQEQQQQQDNDDDDDDDDRQAKDLFANTIATAAAATTTTTATTITLESLKQMEFVKELLVRVMYVCMYVRTIVVYMYVWYAYGIIVYRIVSQWWHQNML